MKVSVIVPVYNASKYLKKCIDSLVSQTLEDIEIICIDNHSSDNSLEILQSYGDKLRIIAQDKTYSQANSMIIGLQEAKGEYIAECDSDDWAALNMYERLYSVAKEHNSDIVQCGFYDYTEQAMAHRSVVTNMYVGSPLDDLRGLDLVGFLGWQPHIQSAIYRRSFLIDNNIWYRDGHNFEDTCLTFKLRTSTSSYAIISDCLYYYRKDNSSSGSATISDAYAVCEQYDEIIKWNNEHNLHLDFIIGVMRYYTYRWNLSRMKDVDTIKNFLARASEDFNKDMVIPEFFCNKEDFEDYLSIKNIPPIA